MRMQITRRGKLKAFGVVFLLIALVVGFQIVRFRLFYYGYSKADVKGFVRKIQYKGPPYCKYNEIEVVAQRGGDLAQGGEIWKYSVDSRDENAPIIQELRAAQDSGKMATIHYRQDLHAWWRCAPTEYFVTGVDREK